MSIHKLSAGSGYDYLTRQVAALDATEKAMSGWPPTTPNGVRVRGRGSAQAWPASTSGVWDAVTAEQMPGLFGAGLHPLAAQRLEQLDADDLTDTNVRAATRLGAPFKVYAGEVSPFRVVVAKRIATLHTPVSAAARAHVRTKVAREFSAASMAVIRSMPARSRPPLRGSRVRAPRRLLAMT